MTRFRGATTLVFVSVLTTCLTGCFLVPEYAIDTKEPTLPAGQTQYAMDDANKYADSARSEINSLGGQVGLLRATADLAIYGGGVATVATAAYKASRDVILGFSLGTASVVGLQYVSGVEAAYGLLDDARLAVDCAQRTARAMDQEIPAKASTSLRDAAGNVDGGVSALQNFSNTIRANASRVTVRDVILRTYARHLWLPRSE